MAALVIVNYIHDKSRAGVAKSSGHSTTKGPRKKISGLPFLFNLRNLTDVKNMN